MAHIHKMTTIDAPIEKVVAFAYDARHWNDWYANLSEPEEIIGEGGVGTVIRHHYHMAGIKFPVTSTILEQTTGPKEATHKLKFEGPLAGNQEFRYKAVGDKTEVAIDIDYVIPGKALGRIADNLLIERMQEKAMEHTLENLKLMCEAEVHAAAAVPR